MNNFKQYLMYLYLIAYFISQTKFIKILFMKQNKNNMKHELYLPAIGCDSKGWETDNYNWMNDTLTNQFEKESPYLPPKEQKLQQKMPKSQKNTHFTSILSTRMKKLQTKMQKKLPNSVHTQNLSNSKDHTKIITVPKREKSTPRILQSIFKSPKPIVPIHSTEKMKTKNEIQNQVKDLCQILQNKFVQASQGTLRNTANIIRENLLTQQQKKPVKGKQFLFASQSNKNRVNEFSKAHLLKKILLRVSQHKSNKVSATRIQNIKKREKSCQYVSQKKDTEFSDEQLFQSNFYMQ